MKKKWFFKREFNKRRLYIYVGLNSMMAFLLIASSAFPVMKKIPVYAVLAVLLFFLATCVCLLLEFIVLIPNATAGLMNICIGSGLLLSLILLTYANIYLQIYRMKGEKAFVFTGKHLSGNDFLYYSITTFTTTGYGDITSIGLISNAVAASEMLMGMITNTIFMAVLTSKLIKDLTS